MLNSVYVYGFRCGVESRGELRHRSGRVLIPICPTFACRGLSISVTSAKVHEISISSWPRCHVKSRISNVIQNQQRAFCSLEEVYSIHFIEL